MPVLQVSNCQISGDLAQAVLDVEQEVGKAGAELVQQLNNIDFSTTASDYALLDYKLDKLMELSPQPLTKDQVTDQTGIPRQEPADTQLDDENRLEELGLILINGVCYVSDGSGNIDRFRRLFYAVGADIDRFLSVVNGSEPFVVIQNSITMQKLPKQASWTLDQAKVSLGSDLIEQVYTAGGDSFCLVPQFLEMGISKERAAAKYGVPQERILTYVFWLNQTRQDSKIISQLNNLGIKAEYLTASITGKRLLDTSTLLYSSTLNTLGEQTTRAISQLNLLANRYTKIDAASQETLRKEADLSISEANLTAFQLQQIVRFYSTVLDRPADISDFLEKNKKADLAYLFTKRLTVSGINFQATPEILAAKIRNALTIQTGTTTVSTALVNSTSVTLDFYIDSANKRLSQNQCAVTQIQKIPVQLRYAQTALSCLGESIAPITEPIPEITPLLGYPSYDSPASIMARQLNFALTLNTDKITAAIEKLLTTLTDPLKYLIAAVLRILKMIRKILDQTYERLKLIIMTPLRKWETLISRYTSYVGAASFDSSVLKCSLGYNLNIGLPLFDDIEKLLELLYKKLRNLINACAQIIYNLLKKLLCYPLNLINGFLTKAESALPSFCRLFRIELPPELEDLLRQLLLDFQLENDSYFAFSKHLIKVNAAVQSLPAKLNQFRAGLVCESGANNSFFTAGQSQISTGFLPYNPAAIAGGAAMGL